MTVHSNRPLAFIGCISVVLFSLLSALQFSAAPAATFPSLVRVFPVDADGNELTSTDGNGNVTTYAYNALDELTQETTPGGETTSDEYDGDGNLTQSTAPNGVTTDMSYTPLNQVSGTTYSDGTPSVSDSYNPDGTIAAMTDGTGTTSYSYDTDGQLSQETNGAGNSIQYSYNADGELSTETYPQDGGSTPHTVSYGYNQNGEETSVTDWLGNESTFAYDANGNLTQEDLPNGVTNSATYDQANNLSGISDTAAGGSGIFSASYTRNANELTTGDTSQPPGSQSYQYTALGQVCFQGSTPSDSCSSPPAGASAYAYDAAGNLTSNAGTTQSFNSDDELCWTLPSSSSNSCGDVPTGATAYSYDENGNLTGHTPSTGEATSSTYNGANEMTGDQVGGNPATSYSYSGNGLLQSETTGDTTTDLTWDDLASTPLLLAQGQGAATTNYVYGPNGLPLEEILPSGEVYYYSQDANGSTRVLTDSSGNVVDTETYSAYGTLTASTGDVPNALLYDGQYEDQASGLYYLRARWYDPGLGQFTSVDPLVQETGQPYQYANGSPINEGDPTGEAGGLCWSWTTGCTSGATDVAQSAVGQAVAGAEGSLTGGESTQVYNAINPGSVQPCSPAYIVGSVAGDVVQLVATTVATDGVGDVAEAGEAAADVSELTDVLATIGDTAGESTGAATEEAASLADTGGEASPAAAEEETAAAQQSSEGSPTGCPLAGGESFTSTTEVVLANGTSLPISDLSAGDEVQATNPTTGKTQAETVDDVWVNDDHDLMDVTVKADGKDSTISTTQHHLFYDVTTHAWEQAEDLKAGDVLLTANGQRATVVGEKVVPGSEEMWDLTVSNDHDFYVDLVSVPTAVLVHNIDCGTTPSPRNTPGQNAVIQLAKEADQRGGLTAEEGQALRELARQEGVPYHPSLSEPYETHPSRQFGQFPHIHVGPVDHLPIIPDL